jgi:hypothetical protein
VPADISPAEMLISDKQFQYYRILPDNALLINSDQGEMTIRLFDKSIIEVAFHPNGFNGYDSSHSVIMEPLGLQLQLVETPAELRIALPNLMVLVQKFPLRLHFFREDELILSEESGFFTRANTTEASGSALIQMKDFMAQASGPHMDLRGEYLGLVQPATLWL